MILGIGVESPFDRFPLVGRRGSVVDGDTLVRTILHSQYGDATLDGTVDTIDFNSLAANFSRSGAGIGWAQADFNGDRSVDTLDFNLLAANFSFHYTEPANAALGSLIPEPAASTTLILLMISTISRRRFSCLKRVG